MNFIKFTLFSRGVEDTEPQLDLIDVVDLRGLAEVSVESYLVGLLHVQLELVGGGLEPVGSPGHQGSGGHQRPVNVIEGQRLQVHVDRLGLSLS